MDYAERFWTKVAIGAPDECWLWQASKNAHGYGQYGLRKLRKGPIVAHRYSWILTHGPIPEGMKVCHRCDNPPCVNPAHLFLGTQTDNVRDATAKRRMAAGPRHGSHTKPDTVRRGTAHHGAKLSEDDVRAIRADTRTYKQIAAAYGLHPMYVFAIRHRRTWRHVS